MSRARVNFSLFQHQLHLGLGAKLKYACWLFISNLIFLTNIPYPNFVKVFFLRLLGAQIGHSCVIKPWVKIKLPWMLTMGDHVWLGESAWLDNISPIHIGNHVCISQNALLLTGNHNYTTQSFDLISKPITVEDGAWICAQATVVGGVTVKSHSVIGIGVTLTHDTTDYTIYKSVPSIQTKLREIR